MMQKLLLILGIFFSCSFAMQASPVDLDEILAVLPHPTGDILILASDLQMTFDGTTRTFYDVVLDGLMELKARDIGMKVSDAITDSMMASIQKRYNLNHSQLIELFDAQGLTLEEARELLKRRKMIDELLGGMLHIDEPSADDIRKYYDAHPDIVDASYTIRLAFVPESDMTWDDLEKIIKNGDKEEKILWDSQETYSTSELADEQQFIITMQPGEVRLMAMVDGGYDVVQLLSMNLQQTAPCDEEKSGRALRQELFLSALYEFHEKLLEKAKIRFCRQGLSLERPTREVID